MKRLVLPGLALLLTLSLGACAAYDQSQPVVYAAAPQPAPYAPAYAYAPAPAYYSYYPGYYYQPYPAYYGPRTSLSFGYWSGYGGRHRRW